MKPYQPLPWQADIWRLWQQQIQRQELAPALLINGLTGLGKFTLARALAYLLLCENHCIDGQVQPKACTKCRSCQLIQSGFHPDLHLIEPEEEGKAILINQIRELTEQVQKTAQQGGYKLVILRPAEAMNTNAANALLKTLEEPEPQTQFILVSDAPAKLPATIRSRCQLVNLAPPSLDLGQAWLKPQLSAEQNPEVLLKAAGGRPLAALKMAQPEAEETRLLINQVLEALIRGADPLEQASKLKKMNLPSLLTNLQKCLADSLRYQVFGAVQVHDSRQLNLYQQLNRLLSPQKILNLEQQIAQLHLQLNRNPNLDLFLENLCLEINKKLHT